jgi:hypothetical protein
MWFSKQPIGKNKLGDLAKTMSQKGSLSGRKVNHSAHKTTVTSLLHSKVEDTQIMHLNGSGIFSDCVICGSFVISKRNYDQKM